MQVAADNKLRVSFRIIMKFRLSMHVRMPLLLAVRQSQNDKNVCPHFQMVWPSRSPLGKILKFLILFIHSNSIPPTTTVDNLLAKQQAAQGKLHVDCGFWGGIIPNNEKQLKPLLDHGVVGFKCFLCPSGVEEFPSVDKHGVDVAYHELKDTDALIAVGICTPLWSLRWRLVNKIRIIFRLSVSRGNLRWRLAIGQ